MNSPAILRNVTAGSSPVSAAVSRDSARRRPHLAACGVLLSLLAAQPSARAAELSPAGDGSYDNIGDILSLSGGKAVTGNSISSAAYVFRDLANASGKVTQGITLKASNGWFTDQFPNSLSIFENTALVGASLGRTGKGTVYVFRNLDTATGTINESANLVPSDSAGNQFSFGISTGLSNSTALVGSTGRDSGRGAVYLYRNVHAASGTVSEHAKLTASDGLAGAAFGVSLSISGNAAIASNNVGQRSVYLFRNLDTATGTVTEHAKLKPSDGAPDGIFGQALSISGNSAVVGAYRQLNERASEGGAVYLYRSLDTATGTITETAKLRASDGKENNLFGLSTSISGNTAIAGARGTDTDKGAAYLFLNLDQASGTTTENVKITASAGNAQDQFGSSVAVDGDLFAVGASRADGPNAKSGLAYSGRVSAFTTLDEGNAARATDRLSFVSQDDWVIGRGTAGNQLTLTAGDTGSVSAAGKAVYVGRAAGADRNRLTVAGNLTANAVRVGAAGNTGNSLRVSGMITTSGGVTVASGSGIGGDGVLTGDLTLEAGAFWEFATSNTLTVTGRVQMDRGFGVPSLMGLDSATPNGDYPLIDGTPTDFAALGIANWGAANAYDLGSGKSAWFEPGGLRLVVVPEPAAGLLGLLAGAAGVFLRRRR